MRSPPLYDGFAVLRPCGRTGRKPKQKKRGLID
nr:MAG TPA: hypothetical protein [Caudoviricetes sp.]